jgi:hypothetical protein
VKDGPALLRKIYRDLRVLQAGGRASHWRQLDKRSEPPPSQELKAAHAWLRRGLRRHKAV